MNDVITLHKADLAAGHKKLASLTPQSGEWWEVKERLKKYEIAFSQSLNLAVQELTALNKNFVLGQLDACQLTYYERLTAPYRPEKKKETKLPAGIVNIDDEIELPQ